MPSQPTLDPYKPIEPVGDLESSKTYATSLKMHNVKT